MLLDSIRCDVAHSSCLLNRAEGSGDLAGEQHWPLIDKDGSFNKHRLLRNETDQRSVVKKGVSQRSNVLSGVAKKGSLLASDLIKTHRIIVIIAIFRPEK